MRRLRIHAQLVSVVILALLLAAAGPALAGDSKPRIVPPDEGAYGTTDEELSTKWWQWVFSLPATDHPLFDGTGAPDLDLPGFNCDAGQHGKVWFLAGTFGGEADRDCTVPNGKALFLPVLNQAYDNVDGDPLTTFNKEQLTQLCLDVVANPQLLRVKIDKVTLGTSQLLDHAVEPTPFRYDVVEEDSIYDLIGIPWPGELDEHGAISCGYYVFLQPLAKGKHSIDIEAENKDGSFSLLVHYDLTVSKSRAKGK